MTARPERQPLRICQVVPYDLSQPGGGVKHHAFELARALRDGGDQVTILGPASKPLNEPGVHGLPGVVNVISNGDNNHLGIFVSPWRIRRFIREHRFDVIHMHEPMVPSICFWTAWLSPGVAKLATFHAYGENPPWALKAAHKAFAAIQFPFIHRAVAVSEPAAQYAGIAWKRPMAIVPNGIHTGEFAPVPAPSGKTMRMLFVGPLDAERKGFRYLLEAYQTLLASGVDVALDVVGNPGAAPLPPALPGLTFHGPVSKADLVKRFQQCDVFVAPSTGQESFGIVLLEAMSTSRAVICADIWGYRQVAREDGALLVPPRDPRALVEAITALARDPARRARMGEANVAHAQAYDWDALAPRLRNEYLEAMLGVASRRPEWREEPALPESSAVEGG
jgi:phosphatidylinositol alpha-mannosyltransferase